MALYGVPVLADALTAKDPPKETAKGHSGESYRRVLYGVVGCGDTSRERSALGTPSVRIRGSVPTSVEPPSSRRIQSAS